MKTPLSAVALTAIVLALASASCTHSDDTQGVGRHAVARAQAAADAVTSLYPPVPEDAGDGHVHEYY